MDNYTMTFKYDGDFDLPNDPDVLGRKVPRMVLEKLENKEFELVDFNLTKNYDSDNVEEYIEDPYLHRSVLEIKLDLTMDDLSSRDAIYNRCLQALQQDELCLNYACENDNKRLGMLQSIIIFEMKKQCSESA